MSNKAEYAQCSMVIDQDFKDLLAYVKELEEFKKVVMSLPQLGEGAHSVTVLHSTSDHKWVVTHRQDNRRFALSDPCDMPDEAVKQAFLRCCRCWLRQHDNWPAGKKGHLCQACWDKQCAESWWAMVEANGGGVAL